MRMRRLGSIAAVLAVSAASTFVMAGTSQAQIPPIKMVNLDVTIAGTPQTLAHVVATGDEAVSAAPYQFAPNREYWFSNSFGGFFNGKTPTLSVSAIDESSLAADLADFTPEFDNQRDVKQSDWTKGVAPNGQDRVGYFMFDCRAAGLDCGSDPDQRVFVQVQESGGHLTKLVWYRHQAPENGMAFDSGDFSVELTQVTERDFPPLTEGGWFYAAQGA
ncbi:hypothetical protein ABZ865_34310 [Streptomyces sp. NPDC047085]|uniref:hypothetical protein n=1 Tax=Streptomyces sp. NPDC047085 TaxID=3155140 RepID=UPI0033F0F9B2